MRGYRLLLAGLAMALGVGSAAAQDWPNRPVKIVHGFPAGAGTDIVARLVADPLSKALGQTVVVEPRSAGGAFVPQPGPLSIVLLDPAREGEAARVARWEIDGGQARDAMQSSEAARGMRLELPWPEQPPHSAKLKLFVRMQTPTGDKLEAERDVFITLPGELSQRWTPRPLDRRDQRSDPAQMAVEPGVDPLPRRQASAAPSQQRVSDSRGAAAPAGGASAQPTGALQRPQWSPTR